MELWIRSQDKEQLIKVDSVYIFHNTFNAEAINFKMMNKCDELGSYTTKERALEVLDEIESLLLGNRKLWNKNKLYSGMGALSEITRNQIYEMPKE